MSHPIYRVVFLKDGHFTRFGLVSTMVRNGLLISSPYRKANDSVHSVTASLFGQVWIDPEVHTLVWPNGADFDPATLHDWPYEISWTVHHLSSHLRKTAERTARKAFHRLTPCRSTWTCSGLVMGVRQSAATGERPTGFVRLRSNDYGLLNTFGVSRSG